MPRPSIPLFEHAKDTNILRSVQFMEHLIMQHVYLLEHLLMTKLNKHFSRHHAAFFSRKTHVRLLMPADNPLPW